MEWDIQTPNVSLAGKTCALVVLDMSRFSSSNASSMRKSLGMPVRASFAPDEVRPVTQNKKSKIPTGKSSVASSKAIQEPPQRRQTVHGTSRRLTHVLSSTSRSSTGR